MTTIKENTFEYSIRTMNCHEDWESELLWK
jgi:hypothetical protein